MSLSSQPCRSRCPFCWLPLRWRALFAPAASATVYTVTMKNGTTFDTRYQPEEASWDANKVVLMTEFGNRIALAGGARSTASRSTARAAASATS